MRFSISINTFGTVVTAVLGLVTMSVMLKHLGIESYGLWALISAVSSYLAFLDFSISAALSRLIAVKRAQSDVHGMNSLMSTAIAVLFVLTLIAAGVTLLAGPAFLSVFHVPHWKEVDTYQALTIAGIGVCASFPLSVFSGFLCGFERFDMENTIEITASLVRAFLLLALVTTTTGLTEVAIIVAATSLASAAAYAFFCWRIEPRLRISRHYVNRDAFRELAGQAGSYWTLVVARGLPTQIAPLVIGHLVGSGAVATFAIARQLVSYGTALVTAAARTATPRAAALYASGQSQAGEALFLDGSRYVLALSLILACGLISLGGPFLHLWQGDRADGVYALLVILLVGETLPMSQWMTASVLSGMGRNLVLAALWLGEAIISLVLTLLLVAPYGLAGACVAVAGTAFLFRGVLQMIWGCRVIGVTVTSYVWQVVLRVALIGAGPLAFGILINLQTSPTSYATFLLVGMAYTALQALFLAPFLLKLGTRPGGREVPA